MVDNSINVLDGCFRAKEHRNFFDAAIEGSRIMITSIVGGTATTCVVFIPLAMLSGLSGQMFNDRIQFDRVLILCGHHRTAVLLSVASGRKGKCTCCRFYT